jgi:small subunit ribosomal protein S4
MHGQKGVKKKKSDYAVALAEKQKLRFQYGLMERQFRKYFEIAARKRGVTGEIMLQLLETRLDNVVFRLGFATSRAASRQFVSHGHVCVNGRKVNISSYNVKPGDVVSVKEAVRSRSAANDSLEKSQISQVPEWLLLDKDSLSGRVDRVPTREEINPIVNEQLIVELYSR